MAHSSEQSPAKATEYTVFSLVWEPRWFCRAASAIDHYGFFVTENAQSIVTLVAAYAASLGSAEGKMGVSYCQNHVIDQYAPNH